MSDEELRAQMRGTVAAFLDAECDSPARRAAMATERGYDAAVFERAVRELGLGELLVPERLGGLGLGFADAAVVIEELGRRTVPSPLPDTLVAATLLAELGADEALRQLAQAPVPIAVCGLAGAAAVAADGCLSGRMSGVAFGASAGLLLVLGDDAALHLVSPEQQGVARSVRWSLDHTRRLADVELTAATARRICPPGDAAVARLRELYRIALATESAAAAEACLGETVEYLKVREQFGRAIGSFQALKHRCADLAVAVHGANATARHAVAFAGTGEAADELGDGLATVAALAKTVCTDTLMRVAADCLQLHGGVGFTFEHDLHLYLKRGKANQLLAGTGPALRADLAQHVL